MLQNGKQVITKIGVSAFPSLGVAGTNANVKVTVVKVETAGL